MDEHCEEYWSNASQNLAPVNGQLRREVKAKSGGLCSVA